MARKATIKYRSLRSNLCHLPLSVYAPLVQQQVRPQSLIIHLTFLSTPGSGRPSSSSSSSSAPARSTDIGWSGLASASSLSGFASSSSGNASSSADTIELDPDVCFSLGWPEGSLVELGLNHKPRKATSISITPESSDDWEILEQHVNFLEDHLLSQLRAAKKGMDVVVWVAGKSKIRLHVDETDPRDEELGEDEAVVITGSTEVFVAPRPRKSKNKSQKGSGVNNEKKNQGLGENKKEGTKIESKGPLSSLDQITNNFLPSSSSSSVQQPTSSFSSSVKANPPTSPFGPNYRVRSIPVSVFRRWPEMQTHLNERLDEVVKNSSGSGGATSVGWVSKRTLAVVREKIGGLKSDADSGSREGSGAGLLSSLGLNRRSNDAARGVQSLIVRMHPSKKTGEEPRDPTRTQTQADANAHEDGQGDEKADGSFELELVSLQGMPDDHVFLWPLVDEEVGEESKKGLEHEWNTVRLSALDEAPSTSEKRSRKKTKMGAAPLPPFSIDDPLSHETEFSSLVGVDDLIEDGVRFFLHKTVLSLPGVLEKPLLITGAQGVGKTSLAWEIAKKLESDKKTMFRPVYIDCQQQPPGTLSGIKEQFRKWVAEAKKNGPSLLILDGIDAFIRVEQEQADNTAVRAVAQYFASSLLDLGSLDIYVIATAIGLTEMHPLMQAKHVFGRTLTIKPLDTHKRRQILADLHERRSQYLVKAIKGEKTKRWAIDIDFVNIANSSEGYSPADLQDLVDLAFQQGVMRFTDASSTDSMTHAKDDMPQIDIQDYHAALKQFKPRSLQNVNLAKSGVEWKDIGGLSETRRLLRETLEWPTKYGAIFAKCPLRLRSGLLLYGFPGCGKTLLASAVAKECGLHFISVKGPELLNKYIGASEKSVRDIFERAAAAKPCVLFFDEFDSIAPKRGHDSTGVTDRVVNQLLTAMDGAEGLDGVYVLAATSRPDLIDPALLRPGRLDKSLICDMPVEEERLEILQAVSRKLDMDPNVQLQVYAEKTEGFSGADLQALVYNAQLEAIHDVIDPVAASGSSPVQKGAVVEEVDYWQQDTTSMDRLTKQAMLKQARAVTQSFSDLGEGAGSQPTINLPKPKPIITSQHLDRSFDMTKPSLSPQERSRLQNIYQSFNSDRVGKLPNGEAAMGVGQRVTLG